MHRLFVAIEPPEAVRATLLAAMGGVEAARWQDDEQLHLTLKFIGEVGPVQAEEIALALSNVRHPPFEVAVRGVGTFERRGLSHTLWAGVAPLDPLTALHRKIDRSLATIGVPADTRAYTPHITLARLNRASSDLGAFLTTQADLATPPWPVRDLCLYESHLSGDGSIYELVERYPLRTLAE